MLLNRRGWSNFLSCRSCGRVWSCPHCDVALVLHRGGGYLACHHCGHREPAPTRCGDCSSMSVARHGAGTERLQHELAARSGRRRLPRLPPRRGRGRRAGADGVGALLRRFQAAESGVLIGTQMVAKGHDFPDVTLGVVLDADATLRFPDFRAEERTFALIAQLAGRVGRGAEGRVLVQTIAPEARSIVHAAAPRQRRLPRGRARAPPRARLPALLAPDQDRLLGRRVPPRARRRQPPCASGLSDGLAGADTGIGEDPAVLGPATLFRLRGRERQVLVVKAAERRPAVRAVGDAVRRVADTRVHTGVNFSVDVDPQ